MAERRQRSTAPKGRASAGPRAAGRTPRAAVRAPRPATAPAPAVVPPVRPRSKLTGRAAVLVLVLAVLTVSYASSMRAYLQQRASINQLNTQIAENSADISELTAEKKSWSDPAYVQQQARLRLGYVLPGEKTYLVLDQNGQPLEAQASLQDPATATPAKPTAWWSTEWDSMKLAGHPPRVSQQAPATTIKGSTKSGG